MSNLESYTNKKDRRIVIAIGFGAIWVEINLCYLSILPGFLSAMVNRWGVVLYSEKITLYVLVALIPSVILAIIFFAAYWANRE